MPVLSTIRDLHEKIETKKISAREVVDSYLKTLEEKDQNISAFLHIFDSRAREEAKRVDAKIAGGSALGLLEGIPIAVKDNILIKGERATAASRILAEYTAAYDAHVIEKLKKEGSIFLGKTNLDEFAMGSSTENSAFGPTKNPHDLSRVPGGSSGGSAAAVASGMAPGALGSDTGGSIRQPAAFCGGVGLRTGYGRVSRSGLMAMASSLDQIGTFGNSVEDAEILFRAIDGHDPLDMTSVEVKEEVSIKNEYRIGVPEEFFASGLDPRIKTIIEKTYTKAEGHGFRFVPVHLPNASYALACYYIIMPAEVSSNLARFDGIRYSARIEGDTLFDVYKNTREEGFGPEVKRRIAVGTYVLSHGYYDAYYLQAQRVRTLITKDFEEVFKKVDVIITPTAPNLPFKFGEKPENPLSMYLEDVYTVPVNLAGLPAISIPAGVVDTLPVGVQFIGKRFHDYELLWCARQYETALA